jgi:CubicO group peptidase (beta-lactamase class C family)
MGVWCQVVIAGLLIGGGVISRPSLAASPASAALSADELTPIADIVNEEIANGHIPGAVVLIGQGHEIVYREAFGFRATIHNVSPMTADTIFDLASLTKVVATTTAVMQLAERGKLGLDAPASRYWPEFGTAGKNAITIHHLLTHYSGLKPDLNLTRRWSGYGTAMKLLVADRPVDPTSTRYIYSDENFEVLGEIVRRVSEMPLDQYCDWHIFQPLGMKDTRFRPPPNQASRIASTSASQANGHASARVNDPTAQRMGGVAGHAGLFSTADDLAIFATMLLDGGIFHGMHLLRGDSVGMMTRPASPHAAPHVRGLGWDLAEPFVSAGDGELSAPSYGHTGFTGTMLWIDPASMTYVIVLSNRTYPDGRGDAQALRKKVLAQVSASFRQ